MAKKFDGTETAWRKALDAATKKSASGYLSRLEIEAALNISHEASGKLLQSLSDDNKLDREQESRPSFDGRRHPRTVYRIKA